MPPNILTTLSKYTDFCGFVQGAWIRIEEIVSGGAEREGGAPPTLAVILMDDADYGRLWEGLPPPMDHQQANQLTTQPPSLGINPQTWWESISGSPPHKSISLFFEDASLFDRGTEASLPCEQSPLLPQPPRFYLHLAGIPAFHQD